jgi:Family of unknown function (DUF6130)
VWADASGLPIILQGILHGPHKVLIELVDANHHTLDKGMVTFVVPEKIAAEKHHKIIVSAMASPTGSLFPAIVRCSLRLR